MNLEELPEPQCDECGCVGKKIQRVYKGRRYCTSCYARLFKRDMCPGCGNYERLAIFNEHARCRRCIAKAPCVRCSRTGKPVGLITEYGPACTSCANHYHTPKPCEGCGE